MTLGGTAPGRFGVPQAGGAKAPPPRAAWPAPRGARNADGALGPTSTTTGGARTSASSWRAAAAPRAWSLPTAGMSPRESAADILAKWHERIDTKNFYNRVLGRARTPTRRRCRWRRRTSKPPSIVRSPGARCRPARASPCSAASTGSIIFQWHAEATVPADARGCRRLGWSFVAEMSFTQRGRM